MAKAIGNENEITLSLSLGEAKALFDVVSLVGGIPYATRRHLIDNIFDALVVLDEIDEESEITDITFPPPVPAGCVESDKPTLWFKERF